MMLTEKMECTLLQIGYGVTGRRGGYFDEMNKRVDMRSAQALYERGLILYNMKGGAPSTGVLNLTSEGWKMFNNITENKEKSY